MKRQDLEIQEQYYKIIESYLNGKTLIQLGDIFNVSSSTILNILRQNKVVLRRRGPKRSIIINDFAFSTLSNDNCYWAGFLAADGNVFGNQVCLQIKDIDHLKKYKDFLNLSSSINYNYVKFRSNQIVEDLKNKFNIVENKSLILKSPNLFEKNLIRNYIRGYFDGDGSLYYSRSTKQINFEIYSGSVEILEWILLNIKHLSRINSKAKVKNKNNNVFRFSISGNKQVCKIMDWLYQDTYYLKRKRIKYQEVKNIIGG